MTFDVYNEFSFDSEEWFELTTHNIYRKRWLRGEQYGVAYYIQHHPVQYSISGRGSHFDVGIEVLYRGDDADFVKRCSEAKEKMLKTIEEKTDFRELQLFVREAEREERIDKAMRIATLADKA